MPSRKRRRRGAGRAPTPQVGLVDRQGRPLAEWKWGTFPVYFGFTSGLLAGYFLGFFAQPTRQLGVIIYAVILFLFSLGLAHLATRLVAQRVLRRRMRRPE